MRQRAIPCLFMRGGTSRGPYFRAEDLPADAAARDCVLLSVMGSPDARQIDGIGGADSLTSKVAIVGPSTRPGVDVDYLFAQVAMDRPIVDTEPSCGNMLAGVGPFAVERGMIRACDPETAVMVYNLNTGARIRAVVQTPGGRVSYAGDQRIDGVPGAAAPIMLEFIDIVGAKCGSMFPTGHRREDIEGTTVSCIDVAMPMVLVVAAELGVSGYETDGLTADSTLMADLERIRREAGRRMGLGEVGDKVVPKIAVLARPRSGGLITSHYFTPDRLHAAHAVTGGICVAACALMPGTVANPLADLATALGGRYGIEHPSGVLEVSLGTSGEGSALTIETAGVVRTARKIIDGEVFVPGSVWP